MAIRAIGSTFGQDADDLCLEHISSIINCHKLDLNTYYSDSTIKDIVEEMAPVTWRVKQRATLELMLENILKGDGIFSLSLNNSYYSKLPNRYNPRLANTKTLRNAIAFLKKHELVEHFVGFRGRRSYMSRIVATSKLRSLFRKRKVIESKLIAHPNEEIIILKNEDKKLIEYSDSIVSSMRDRLQRYNEFMSTFLFEYAGAKKPKNFRNTYSYRRIFNNSSFTLGGRYYSDYQNLRKIERENILINGERTCEIDYSGMHINILYAWKTGKQYDGDVYDVGMGRKVREDMKVMLQIALNAQSDKKAKAAFRYHCMKKKRNFDPSQLIDLFIAKHEPIKEYFFSGIGLKLQRYDSLVVDILMSDFIKRGIPLLSVHDSCITTLKHRKLLISKMAEVSMRVFRCEIEVK